MVIGSQSTLGAFPNAPEDLLVSMEADVFPKDRPEQARRLGLSATRAWIQGGAVRGTVETSGASARSGALAALGCYLLWGLVPLYWKRLAAIDSLELIAHRHLWSLALLALLMMVRGEGWSSAVAALSTVRGGARLILASLLLTTNWLVYVWGVNTGRTPGEQVFNHRSRFAKPRSTKAGFAKSFSAVLWSMARLLRSIFWWLLMTALCG